MAVSPYLPPELHHEINCAKTPSTRTGIGGLFDFPEGYVMLRPIDNMLYDVFKSKFGFTCHISLLTLCLHTPGPYFAFEEVHTFC
jgi:hypothetical protein